MWQFLSRKGILKLSIYYNVKKINYEFQIVFYSKRIQSLHRLEFGFSVSTLGNYFPTTEEKKVQVLNRGCAGERWDK